MRTPWAETRHTGKSAFSDLHNRRPTLPLLLTHRDAQAEDQELVEQLLDPAMEPPEDVFQQAEALVHRTGALFEAERMAREEVHQAQACLKQLPPGPSRSRLEALAQTALERGR